MLRLFAAALACAAMAWPMSSFGRGIPAGAALSVPSAQNSGAGIPGLPDDEDGPAVLPAATTGAGATVQRTAFKPAVREQDTAGIAGLPGAESGPAVRPPGGGTG